MADMDQSRIDTVQCLGDMIGYGPEPDTAVLTIRDGNIPAVMGNHELAVVDPEHLAWFNPAARESLEKTVGMLSQEALDHIQNLPCSRCIDHCRLVHGFPPDSPLVYVAHASEEELKTAFRRMKEEICFAGHTHELEIIDFDGEGISRRPLPKGVTHLPAGKQYIVNIGSVGQPRDGNNNAKYAIWDSTSRTVELRFIPYDIKTVADKIIHLGLPSVHARKLW